MRNGASDSEERVEGPERVFLPAFFLWWERERESIYVYIPECADIHGSIVIILTAPLEFPLPTLLTFPKTLSLQPYDLSTQCPL